MTTAKQEIHQSPFNPIITKTLPYESTDILIPVEEFYQVSSLDINEPSLQENIARDNLASMQINQKKLSDLQNSLENIIDVMSQNQSVLSQLSVYWGEMPLWLKIISGSLLIIPTLVLGIVTNIWILIAVSVLTLIAYTVVSLLLDNHYNNSTQTSESLRTGITSLGNVLISVIDSLEIIKQQFSQAINEMTYENERLTKNVDALTQEVNSLTQAIEQLKMTELALRAVHNELEITTKKITHSLEEQSLSMQSSQVLLNQAQQDFQDSQNQLFTKTDELSAVKNKLTLKVEQFQSVCNTLEKAMNTMSCAMLSDTVNQRIFQQRLHDFIKNKDASFDCIVERICKAEKQLVLVSQQLDLSNKRYQELLDRQEIQVSRLEQIVDTQNAQNTQQITSPSHLLSNLGLYATKHNTGFEQDYGTTQEILSTC